MATRHERKMKRKAELAAIEAVQKRVQEQAERYAKEHPILSGRIKIEDYRPAYNMGVDALTNA